MVDIVKKVRDFVQQECKKSSSKCGYGPFHSHFAPTVKYARRLADELGGDKEIILIAAWLHDIGSVVCGRKDHHITGVMIAEKKLQELKYPIEKIKIVKQCILTHRGSQENNRRSIEEKIVTEADVLSNFDDIAGLFEMAYVYEHKTRKEAKKSVRQKLINKWNQLHFKESKKILEPKFKAAMLLLE